MADAATPTLNNSTQSLSELVNILRSAFATGDAYTRPEYTPLNTTDIRDAEQLSNELGVNFTYDRNEIEKIYQDATKAAMRTEAESGAERKYYKNLSDAQNTALDAIRQTFRSAVATGANKGMQAANTLSAILGFTQQAGDEATQLAVDRQNLANNYAAQLKEDSAKALQYSNEMGNTIGSMAHQLFNDEIQELTARLGYNQALNTDYAGYGANKYTADANKAGTLGAAGAGVYNNTQSAIAAIRAAVEAAEAQKYASEKNQTQNINYSGGYTVK